MLIFLETLAVALFGGYAFLILHLPLPWMLGPLTAVQIWKVLFKRELYWPAILRNSGYFFMGILIGFSFTPEIVVRIITHLPFMLFSTLVLFFYGILSGYLLSKRTGIDLLSCMLGNIPGGAMQMLVLSSETEEVDLTSVAFLQTIRLLSILFLIPFIAIHGLANNAAATLPAGSAALSHTASQALNLAHWPLFLLASMILIKIGVRKKYPAPYMLGPLFGAAALVLVGIEAPYLPGSLTTAAQVSLGIYIGISTETERLKNLYKILPYSLLICVGMVICSLGIAYALTYFKQINMITGFLSASPGGMSEMAITAMAVRADLPLVASYQLFRLVFILLMVPILLKYWLRKTSSVPQP